MGETGSEGRDTLSIRDNRTGREYEIDVLEGDVIRQWICDRSKSRTQTSA
ncbi:MAG: hypothetical protein MK239_07705 [Gemmatimonadetes bacterium]|nr:hypothetical protein [Gemmatimonadota bacterium]